MLAANKSGTVRQKKKVLREGLFAYAATQDASVNEEFSSHGLLSVYQRKDFLPRAELDGQRIARAYAGREDIRFILSGE